MDIGDRTISTSLDQVLIATERSLAPASASDGVDGKAALASTSDNALAQGQVRTALVLRGKSDRNAVYKLHHDEELHSRLLPEENAARTAFHAAERARVESLGIRCWAGMRSNFRALFAAECERAIADHYFSDRPDARRSLAFSIAVTETLLKFDVPSSIRAIVAAEVNKIKSGLAGKEAAFDDAALDQFAFACMTHGLLSDIGLERKRYSEDELRRRAGDRREEYDPSDLMKKRRKVEQSFSGNDAKAGKEVLQPRRARRETAMSADSRSDRTKFIYKPYTRDYDAVVRAVDLANAQELTDLRRKLDAHLLAARSSIGALANRLQRRLQVLQRSEWNYDVEEGLLDVSKLTRIVTDPVLSASYKIEKESELGSVVISVLLDNSASMKGEPIRVAACCADILAQALERCGVKLEVLGFTTAEWNGGRSRRQWSSSTRESTPGRLNDLRHIVYKSADERWRRSKLSFALMMKDDILKENIDGEALAWAHERLLKRGEDHRILIVVSDGAPADHSTLTLNGRDYLADNLRDVISRIEGEGMVELVGIGVGHDLSAFYKKSIRIEGMAKLASALTSELVALLERAIRKKI